MNREQQDINFLLMLISLILLALVGQGCKDRSVADSPAPTNSTTPTTATAPESAFERDLNFVRKGQFKYIWVFARKDGKPLDREDAAYLRKNAPQVVDWVTTEEGKRVIAGTNFNLEEGNLGLLRERFIVSKEE